MNPELLVGCFAGFNRTLYADTLIRILIDYNNSNCLEHIIHLTKISKISYEEKKKDIRIF